MPPRRGHSGGGWGRLRPVEQDPLDVYGLPSKGETKLSDFKTQERYYGKIIERYLAFCADADGRDALLERFASLEPTDTVAVVAQNVLPVRPRAGSGAGGKPAVSSTAATAVQRKAAPASSAVVPSPTHITSKTAASKDLSAVLMALRKLREAIVATNRADDFAAQAYLFCIRTAVLAKQHEAYHPAILHLLRVIHRLHPLTSVEHHEVTAFLVLDAACRRRDLAAAYQLRFAHKVRSTTVDAILAALAHDDWVAFRRVRQRVDGYQARLLEFAEHDLRVHTLKCFGRAYLRLEHVAVLEAATGVGWSDLQTKYGVGWERDGDAVIIRKIQPKKPQPATGTS